MFVMNMPFSNSETVDKTSKKSIRTGYAIYELSENDSEGIRLLLRWHAQRATAMLHEKPLHLKV